MSSTKLPTRISRISSLGLMLARIGDVSKKQAEVERDKFLAKINKPSVQEKITDGLALAG